MRRGASLVLMVVCCVGCSSSKTIPANCAKVVRAGALRTGPLFPSVPAAVTAGVQFIGCDSKLQVTAAVSVTGPEDETVDSTFTIEVGPSSSPLASQLAKETLDAGAPSDGLTALAHVTFTPTKPGLHHLTVRFDPGLGTVQADLNVLEDRRPAAFQTLPMPFQCDDFDFQLGVGLCLSGGAVLAVVDGGQVASASAIAFAADGADVWTLAPGGAASTLFLTCFSLTASGALSPLSSTDVGSYSPGSGAVLRSSGQRVGAVAQVGIGQLLVFEASLDGGIVPGADSFIGMSVGQVALQWAPGAGAVCGGTVFANSVHHEVCEISLFDGGQSCVQGTGFSDPGPITVGSDGAAFWSQDSSGTFTAWSALADGGFNETPVSFGSAFSFLTLGSGGNSSGPVIRDDGPAGVQLPSTAPPYLLQAYGLPPSLPNTPVRWGSSSRLYWEWHADNGGTIVYFLR